MYGDDYVVMHDWAFVQSGDTDRMDLDLWFLLYQETACQRINS